MIKKNRAEERLCPDFCAFVLFESSLCQTQKKSHTVWCGMTGRTRSPVVCAQSRHPHTKEQSTGLFFSAAPNVLFESSLCQTQKKIPHRLEWDDRENKVPGSVRPVPAPAH